MKTSCKAACAGLGLSLALMAGSISAQGRGLSDVQKAAEALQISNVMGRYAAYVIANHWSDIGDMFALDDPDVHQNVPFQMSGPQLRKYFADRQAEKLKEGVIHQHAFMSPIIEVAGDGKTAKGVWDSPGIDAGSGNAMANWAWVRYAVDFKRIQGQWKIWHMSVLPVWRAAYGPSWSDMVNKDSSSQQSGGGTGGQPLPAIAAPTAAPTAPPPSSGAQKWRYNGVGDTPLLPANLPKPYYTFDPKDSY